MGVHGAIQRERVGRTRGRDRISRRWRAPVPPLDNDIRTELVESAWVGAFMAYITGAITLEAMWAIEEALAFPPRPWPLPDWARHTGSRH
jgi:hypothetical protein